MDNQKIRTPLLKDSDLTVLAEQADCGLIIFVNDSKTTLLFANEFFFSILGYTRDEYIDQYNYCFSPCIHPDDAQKFKRILARQYAMGKTLRFECRAMRKDGTMAWVLLRGRLHDEHIPPTYFCSCMDITEIRESYDGLSQAKKEMDTIANNLPGGILKVRMTDFKILYANDGFYGLSGLTREEYKSRYESICTQVILPEDKPSTLEKVREAVKKRAPLSLEYRIRHSSGQTRWSYLNGSLIEEMDGSPVYLCVIVNITRIKEYEAELTLTQRKQQLLYDFANEINWEYDWKNDTLKRSGKLELTYSPSSLIMDAKKLLLTTDTIHSEDREKFLNFLQSLEGGLNYVKTDLRIKNYSGTYSQYIIQGVSLYDDSGKCSMIIGKTSEADSFRPKENTVPAHHSAELMAKYTNYDYLKNQVTKALTKSSGKGELALYIVTLQNCSTVKRGYGSFLYHTIVNEIASKIDASFPGALKSYVGKGEFVIFENPAPTTPAAVKAKAIKFTDSIYAAFGDADGMFPIEALTYAGIAEPDMNRYDDFYEAVLQHGAPDPSLLDTPSGFSADLSEVSTRELHFILNVVDYLGKAEDNPTAIKLALVTICNFYNAEQICIFEDDLDHRFSRLTYDWCVAGCSGRPEGSGIYPYESIRNYKNLFDEDGIFTCTDLSVISKECPIFYDKLSGSDIHSMLQCGLYENGVFYGFLSLNYYEKPRLWNSHEVECLKILSRLISYKLCRFRKKGAEAPAEYLDPVTGLIRFPRFMEAADRYIREEAPEGINLALIYSDINRFNYFNTKYGFSMGNKLLKFLGHSILNQLKPDELCARIQGDHFITLIKYGSEDDLNSRLALFHEVLIFQEPEEDIFYSLSLSSGVYLLEKENVNLADTMDKADFARKSVKQMSDSCKYTVYSRAMDKWNEKEKALLCSLETAFINREFIPYYQPVYNLFTDELYSLEALARWKKPGGSRVLYPPEFLSLLEKNHQITELDFQIIEEVCKTLHSWAMEGRKLIPVSVNISGAHLGTRRFAERLTALTERYQVPPESLILEFTEKLFIKEPEPLYILVNELTKAGFSITIDDFGEEYSSMNLLKRFPISAIKFDTSFFQGKKTEERDKTILKKTVEMAKELGILVLTENVETTFQAGLLKDLGCEFVQGFLYNKPMPLEDIEKYVL